MSDNENQKLRRGDASKFLRDRYGPAAPSRLALAQMACKGLGPKHTKFGVYPIYETDDLIAWGDAQVKQMKTGGSK